MKERERKDIKQREPVERKRIERDSRESASKRQQERDKLIDVRKILLTLEMSTAHLPDGGGIEYSLIFFQSIFFAWMGN